MVAVGFHLDFNLAGGHPRPVRTDHQPEEGKNQQREPQGRREVEQSRYPRDVLGRKSRTHGAVNPYFARTACPRAERTKSTKAPATSGLADALSAAIG